jgi:hypothetical protein
MAPISHQENLPSIQINRRMAIHYYKRSIRRR